MSESFLNGRVVLHAGDSRDVLKTIADNSIDSIVTDPPYALVSIVKRFGAGNAAECIVPEGGSGAYKRASAGFMGKTWDTGETAFDPTFWAECLRVLKPGGHIVAFSGTRTYHRMTCAIEDAGFEVRDMLSWLYGSGFPKSHNVGKGIDAKLTIGTARTEDIRKMSMGEDYEPSGRGRINYDNGGGSQMNGMTGGERVTHEAQQWQGWGTALKPACEPIAFGRKPLIGTVAQNVLEHGTGAINIDGCRVGFEGEADEAESKGKNRHADFGSGPRENAVFGSDNRPRGANGNYNPPGRWPANILHDGSEDVISAFPDTDPSTIGKPRGAAAGDGWGMTATGAEYDDSGSAARFFYTAKANADDRLGSKHPTVKPVDLMQWLCRLVTPKGGTVLDPFAGTGTTGEAAFREGFNAVLIEREAEYQADIRRRMALSMSGPDERKRESIKAKVGDLPFEPGSLFASIGGEAGND